MIRYALVCDGGHGFESWFRDSDAFDELAAQGHVNCPNCGSSKVAKQIMSPKIARSLGREIAVPSDNAETETASELATEAAPAQEILPPLTEQQAILRDMVVELRKAVAEQSDYVGTSFAEEARKMHYGEVEERPIWGEASRGEAKDLAEEGIDIMPLPDLPSEGH